MPNYIQLTDYEFGRENVYFLNETCIPFSDSIDEEKILLKDRYECDGKIDQHKKTIWANYEKALPVLADFFNASFKQNYSTQYWERIIGNWLISVLDNLFDKYNALKEIQSFNIDCMDTSAFQTPSSIYEFALGLRGGPEFHLQLYSILLQAFFEDKMNKHKIKWNLKENAGLIRKNTSKTNIKKRFKSFLFKFLDKGYFVDNALYVSLFDNKSLLTLFIRSRGGIAPILQNQEIKYEKELNAELRNRFYELDFKDDFLNTIMPSVLYYLYPLDLLEGYMAYHKSAYQLVLSRAPKRIVTGIGFLWNTHFSVWASLCKELKDTQLYGLQHGGTYGEVETLDFEIIERRITDQYLSWGWDDCRGDLIPFYSPRFVRFKMQSNSSIKSNIERVLWVTTADSKANYFTGHIVFGERFLNYFKHQRKFYQSLSSDINTKVYVRLYPEDFGWNLSKRWLNIDSKIKFSNINNFNADINQSDLIILDHLGGTTFLEAILMNKPVLIIANKALFKIRSSAILFYEQLEKAGILHYSTKSFNETLKEISKIGLNNWYGSIQRQKALLAFKDNFVLIGDNGLSEWLNILNKD